jgi:hypothetical protein
MYRHPVRPFVIAAAVFVAGCSLKPAATATGKAGAGGEAVATGGNGGGGGTAGRPPLPDAGIGLIWDAQPSDATTTMSTIDANCGAKSKMAAKLPPNILVLLDRSASMSNDISDKSCPVPDAGVFGGGGGDCGPSSKWAQILPALTQVISETESDVNWGLKFFPDNATNVCTVNTTPEVAIAPKNSSAIASAIKKATSTAGGVAPLGANNMHVIGTPTRSGVMSATTYMRTLTDMGPKIILLATDGMPTCPGASTGPQMATANDMPAAVSAVIKDAQDAGFKTFVVGIGTSGTTDADAILSDLANAGGLPRAGTPSYYQVNSFADLSAAIRTLVGVAATCTFQIGPAPDDGSRDLSLINVFGDGHEITRDPTHADGYDYTDPSMQTIEVFGPKCQQILTGAIKDVTITFQCIVP